MIVDIPNTTVSGISKALVRIREEGGQVALGRVLTLIIAIEGKRSHELVIRAANEASREHPMRLIVLHTSPSGVVGTDVTESRLDAEIRVGGDAGASEVIVLKAYGALAETHASLVTGLLLPDAPVAVWWPAEAPSVPSDSPLGKIAVRRITDVSSVLTRHEALAHMQSSYRPGDTDFAWSRLTLWRSYLAAALDQLDPREVTTATVEASTDSASAVLLAAWLEQQLRIPVELVTPTRTDAQGIVSVRVHLRETSVVLTRADDGTATLGMPDGIEHQVALPRRSDRDALSDELRWMTSDETYGRVVQLGLPGWLSSHDA